MNGSIQKRGTTKGRPTWQITIDLGKDPHGKRQRHTENFKGTKAQAQTRLRELIQNLEKGLPLNTSKATLAEFLDQWLKDYADTHTSARTVAGYKGNINRYLKPTLGHIPIVKLTPQHIQSLYADMLAKPLSPRTILHTHRVLSEALNHAVKWGLLARNVCDAVTPPRVYKKEMKALDTQDIQRLLDAINTSPYGSIIFLALFTGLRRSEVLGLRWSDIDLKNKTLTVNQTVLRIPGKGLTINTPKTAYSQRSISLSPRTAGFLKGLKAKRMEEHRTIQIDWNQAELIFCNIDGEPLHPDTITKAFHKIITKLGMNGVRFHDLRHTNATHMLKQKVPVHVVSQLLGHASPNITLDIYSHVISGQQEAAVLAFDQAMEEAPEATTSHSKQVQHVSKMSAISRL